MIYVKEEENCQILNNRFQSVFTKVQPFAQDELTLESPYKLETFILQKDVKKK